MRLIRPSPFMRLLFPEAIFRIEEAEKELYLTFDDGPDPESTPGILDILEAHDAGASFFCLGEAAEKYPALVSRIRSQGNVVGNHGYRHLNGWITNTSVYIRNINRAAEFTSANLLRPPYGWIRPSQYRELVKNYRVVFWDLMPYDFDSSMSAEKILKLLRKKIRPGSVIVLHDSKTSSVLSFLGDFIRYAGGEGYAFRILTG